MTIHKYDINGSEFTVFDLEHQKVVKSPDYNYVFRKVDGFFARWGKTQQDDPQWSPIGPEILDIEISVNGCPNACRFCSPAGTKVLTPSGEKNIEEIQVGDSVIGARRRNQIVEKTFVREYEGDIVQIQLASGRTLLLTPEHPVILVDGTEIKAGDLTSDMEILDAE